MTILTYPLFEDRSLIIWKRRDGNYGKVIAEKSVQSKAAAILKIIGSNMSAIWISRKQRKEMTIKNLIRKNAALQLGLEYIRDFTAPDKANPEAQLKYLQNFAGEFLQNIEEI